jgi:hypothetical protein
MRPARPGREPPRYKRAVVSALAVFPVVLLVQGSVDVWVADWPLAVRTLVLTALVAPALTYGTLPLAAWVLRGWLRLSTIPSSRCADAAVPDADSPAARVQKGPATNTGPTPEHHLSTTPPAPAASDGGGAPLTTETRP